MAVYKCPSCSRRLSFPAENGPTYLTNCPACNEVKTFVKAGDALEVGEADAAMQRANALHELLPTYKGTQAIGYSDIEAMIYAVLQEAVATAIGQFGQANIQPTLKTGQQVKQLLSAADSKSKHGLVIGDLPVYEYDLTSVTDIITFIRLMGADPNTNLPGRIVNLFGLHTVYLTPKDHYCYPLRWNQATVDLANYPHEYAKLMNLGIDAEAQTNFLKTGACGSFLELGANVANLIAESDRNWVQFI